MTKCIKINLLANHHLKPDLPARSATHGNMTNQPFGQQVVSILHASINTSKPLPLFLSNIQAGFPSPADDFLEKQLDLNELMIKNGAATFFVRVVGESMKDAGIHSGDLLVVDRSIKPTNGKIIVAIVNGEFTVKRIKISDKGVSLVPDNPLYPSIEISLESDFQAWGVVTYVIHRTL
jgi:DNA polymerase V